MAATASHAATTRSAMCSLDGIGGRHGASSARALSSRQSIAVRSGRLAGPSARRDPSSGGSGAHGSRRRTSSVKAVIQEPPTQTLGSLEDLESLPIFRSYAQSDTDDKPRIVVLGSGWGAVSAVKALKRQVAEKYNITLVSPRNYFMYTPLLPAVASGTCEERSIVEPVRNFLDGKAEYFEAVCQEVDHDNKRITACFRQKSGNEPDACFHVPYDILVVAVGSTTNTFGCPGVEEHCTFFKTLEDAKKLRSDMSDCFERAALPFTTDEEKARLLSFVVVGGGPTGVEVAAEVHDMVDENLARVYPDLMKFFKIRLIDSNDHVLGTYDRAISHYTQEQFGRSGIEIVSNSRVVGVRREGVEVLHNKTGEKELLPYGACVWATGIKMNPLVKKIQEALPAGSQEHFRCLMTDEHLRVKGSGGSMYCIGDAGTIAQDQAHAHAAELFQDGDVNGDGKLQLDELRDILMIGSAKYPQLAEYAKFLDGKSGSNRFGGLVKQVIAEFRTKNKEEVKGVLQDLDMQSELTQDEFQELLTKIDAGLRALPATAQVAKAQGEYFASLLSSGKEPLTADADLKDRPAFKYFHKGSLAYIGGDQAVLDAPVLGSLSGLGVGYLWKGYETYGQFSVRNRVLVAMDWMRSKIFGRDISRI